MGCAVKNLQINTYLDANFLTGMSWKLIWAQEQATKNFRTAFSSADNKTNAVGQRSLQERTSSVASRVKHFSVGLLLAIPLISAITILALRRFGNIFIVQDKTVPQTPSAEAPLATPASINKAAEDERPASSFLCPQRFDLMAKIIYAELRKKGVACGWGEQIYLAHIRAWGGGEFRESRDPNAIGPQLPKTCKEDFIGTFNGILDAIARDGFDKSRPGVPVGSEDGVPVNGAHRLTACFVHEKPVKFFKSLVQKQCGNWNYEYWSQSCGLEEKYLDAMALKYCELKKNMYTLALFPCSRSEDKDKRVRELIAQYGGSIAYSKEFVLNRAGGKNFVVTSYYRDSHPGWLGTAANCYKGCENSAWAKFPDRDALGPMQMLLFESDIGLEKIVELKTAIRELYGFGKTRSILRIITDRRWSLRRPY